MDNISLFLEMNGISKSFGGVRALSDVQLHVMPGEIHALVGENGAGKSTLMKILGGVYQPDSGTIRLAGREVTLPTPIAALEEGIAVIHQDLNVLPHLSVTENIWMGRYPRRFGVLSDWRRMHREAEKLLGDLNAQFSSTAIVENLSTADKQLVIIARGLSYSPKILIFDEPTASLTPNETETLFQIIRRLSASGVSIIFISHHLDEVIELADHITVLRDGALVATYKRGGVNEHGLAQAMVGRQLQEHLYPEKSTSIGDVLLEVKNLSYKNRVKDVSFVLQRGEILGLAGLVGAGRSDLVHCIYGAHQLSAGSILKEGRQLTLKTTRDAIREGIALVPEDRHEQGLLLNKALRFNISLSILTRIMRLLRIDNRKEIALSEKMIHDLSIKTTGPDQEVQNLSGGNQQKVLFGKVLATNPDVLILDEPTRGVDVGAKAAIHQLMRDLTANGMGIILVSSDLPEIIGMSDRVLVISEGRAAATLKADQIDPTTIMVAATGGT